MDRRSLPGGVVRRSGRQNIVLSLAEVAGTSWMTSQCSAIFPSWKRKMSKTASPGGAGDQDAAGMQEHQVALGDGPPDVEGGVGELLSRGGAEGLHRRRAVGGEWVVLDVVRPYETVDDGRVAPVEHGLEGLGGDLRLPRQSHPRGLVDPTPGESTVSGCGVEQPGAIICRT
jgi:hypothetical protein